MNDNPDSNYPTGKPPVNPPDSSGDWRSLRQAEREQRREQRRSLHRSSAYSWVSGAVLILPGLAFLVQTTTGFSLNNWWALVILIPAAGAFISAYESCQANRRVTPVGRGSLIPGLFLAGLTVIFLFNFSFSYFWPALIILVGIGLLAGAFFPQVVCSSHCRVALFTPHPFPRPAGQQHAQ